MSNLYSKILKKVINPIADMALNTNVMHYYSQIKKMEEWSVDEITNWQNEKLQKIINYAYYNTEYYNELFNINGIRPDDIKSKADLVKVPILTRDALIKNYDKLTSKNISSLPHLIERTGGTTGQPMSYILDKKSWGFTNANNMVNWEKTAYNYGDKYIALGSTSIFVGQSKSFKHKIFYKLKNKISLNGMNVSDDDFNDYVGIIKKENVKFIYGYASSIYLFAQYILKNSITMDIKACFPTSEILLDEYRSTLINAFNCKVVNCYGANDGGITGFEHKQGNFEVGYNTIVRIEDLSRESKLKGPILITNLLNQAMPMINYQLGDEVKMKIKNGNYNGQLLEKVYGRTPDIIRLENGNILTGFSFYSKIFRLPVKAWNLEKIGINTLCCTVIKLPEFNDLHESELISKLKIYAGDNSKIEIKYSDRFELTKSGKRKHFISE